MTKIKVPHNIPMKLEQINSTSTVKKSKLGGMHAWWNSIKNLKISI